MLFLLPAGVARRFASPVLRQVEAGCCQRLASQATRRVASRRAPTAFVLLRFGLIGLCCSAGCKDDSQTIRKIQTGRQVRQQAETKVDQLAEAFSLVSRLIGLQRAGVFVALCRQVDLPACLLATAPGGDGTMRPWAVGVLIGGEVYLFDCRLAVPVVGPNQSGVATLAQARSDATVLRRMNVPGWFEYPLQMADIQQCVALLMLDLESMSLRAKRLQGALTGDLRLGVYDDPVRLAEQFEAVSGIASARIWEIPLLARAYREAIEDATQQDPLLAFFIKAPWMILESPAGQSQELALGRWRHLQGRFESEDEETLPGAKRLYLDQRQPDFEISDLRGDVELQMRYGIRRELGVTPEQYDMQIQQIQALMRQGKVTASFWLSLIQYDSERFDLARSWFDQRVMAEGVDSIWKTAARYNLARTFERLGESERAAEMYRIEGDPQEHGNRIRARLITRGQSRSEDL